VSAAVFFGLVVAPTDAVQGNAQRLMYVHVPAIWTAYMCFVAVFLCSIGYLRKRNLHWDHLARACAETGVFLTATTIASGAVWGAHTWGTWWTWDARLVSTAVLLLVYIAYLAVRHLIGEPHRGARLAAYTGLAGLLMVPVVHFSVVWGRTLHQPPTILGPTTSPPIDPLMALALAVSVLAVTIAAGWAIACRYTAISRRAAQSPWAVVNARGRPVGREGEPA
jgi:heme exporter protein C